MSFGPVGYSLSKLSTKLMDILVITREFPPYILGGISYHLHHLYKEVQNLGHDITVISGVCPQSNTELEDFRLEGIDVHPVQFGYRKGYYVLFPVALQLFLSDFDTERFDVALTHTQVPFDLGIPTVAKHHDCLRETRPYIRNGLSAPERLADSLLHPLRCRIDDRALAHADHGTFNSELTRTGWSKHYELPDETSVIYNGVDTDIFHPRTVDSSEDTDEYVLFVGDSERKGLSKVLSYSETTDRAVKIVGLTNTETSSAEALGKVSQADLANLYSGATVTIHPTGFEAFGNVILESIACGTPVVTTHYCGAAEVLDESCAVIAEDIQIGVERAQQLSSSDCVSVAQRHTWGTVAEETVDIARDVASRS